MARELGMTHAQATQLAHLSFDSSFLSTAQKLVFNKRIDEYAVFKG